MATATARKTAAKKAATKAPATPAKEAPVKGQHRSALLDELKAAGWTGPTSYTATALRETLLPWVKAGCPAGNEGIPAGAMNHAHPKPKVERKTRASKARVAALGDVATLIQGGASLADVKKWLAEQLQHAS
ncbi:hypothetical protein [Nocardioides daphniae]|uniref:Uncharacterized protein n=1 Tax=Nocardioides daphniae TaxID=402297 RepID=A0A4P7UBL9_9ACTN|nr:hypothetical protein [Nocardioides daphniae]QCC76705.1 hypothetical protein E2C04_04775 [Nocardioides daphniae]GGD15514.1 hypothetical protein GCM10007231_13160 [Nocardioides daphniae]